MAQFQTKKLDTGEHFPKLELHLIDRGSLLLPDASEGRWATDPTGCLDFVAYHSKKSSELLVHH